MNRCFRFKCGEFEARNLTALAPPARFWLGRFDRRYCGGRWLPFPHFNRLGQNLDDCRGRRGHNCFALALRRARFTRGFAFTGIPVAAISVAAPPVTPTFWPTLGVSTLGTFI